MCHVGMCEFHEIKHLIKSDHAIEFYKNIPVLFMYRFFLHKRYECKVCCYTVYTMLHLPVDSCVTYLPVRIYYLPVKKCSHK